MRRFLYFVPSRGLSVACVVSILSVGFSCGAPPSPSESSSDAVTAGDLTVEVARVQIFGEVGAAFFHVHNSGSLPERLIRVESPSAASAETHETVMDGTVMKMEPREEGFMIPPGETLRLEPGGKHVMLLGLEESAASTDPFVLRLVFEHYGTLEIPVATGTLTRPIRVEKVSEGSGS